MKIQALLKKITPLPWSKPHFALSQEFWDKVPTLEGPKSPNQKSRCDCKYILCDSLMGAVATVHCAENEENEGDDPLPEAAKANAIYLAHAANVLPELIEASKAMTQHVTTPQEFQRFIDALNRAEEISEFNQD